MEPTPTTKPVSKSKTMQGIILLSIATGIQILVFKKVISNEIASIIGEYLSYLGQILGASLVTYGRLTTKGEPLTWTK